MQDSPAPTLSLLRHIILFALAAIMVLWPLHSLFGSSGLFAAQFSRSLPRQSALECLLVMGLAYGGLRARSRRLGMFLVLVVAELYARRHGVDISIVLLAAYALGIYCAGDNAGQWLYPQDEVDAGSLLRSAFIGVVMWSLVIWLASLAGWGSIRQIRWLAVVFLGANLLAWVVRLRSRRHDVAAVAPTSISRVQAVVYAAVMSTVLLMFAKAAVAIDFDSLWYGVRADRVLLAAGNLYADEGLVAHVHYYPKLFESLQIPFIASGSLSLIVGTSILSWLLLMATVYLILGEFDLSIDTRLLGSLLAGTIPAVCNSALTSKGELFAAWLCLFALYGAFRYARNPTRHDWWALACASALLGPMGRLSVLPYAALIFLYAVALVAWPGRHRRVYDRRFTEVSGTLAQPRNILIPPVLALALIALVCLRTYWLTGMPLTTPDVLIELQRRLGLHLHDAIGQYRPGYRMPFPAGLYNYLLDPSRYVHLALFWTGNVWLFVIIAAWLLNGWRWMIDSRIVMLIVTGLCFFAVLFGYRSTADGADGNYFIVPVTCLLMAGVVGLFATASSARAIGQRSLWIVLSVFLVSGLVVLLGAANWQAGTRRLDFQFDRQPFAEMPAMANDALTKAGLLGVATALQRFSVDTRAVGDIGEDLGAYLPLRYESLRTIAWQRAKLLQSPEALAAWLAVARIRIVIIQSPAASDPVDQQLAATIVKLANTGAATRLDLPAARYAVWQLEPSAIVNSR